MSTPHTPGRTKTGTTAIDLEVVIASLASSLGVEKARALVSETLRTMKIPEGPTIDAGNCTALLEQLAAQQGLVGIAARVTKIMLLLRTNPAP